MKKLENGELKIVLESGRGINLQRALQPPRRVPLRLVLKSEKADTAADLIALTNAAGVWSERSTNQDLERAPDIARDKPRAARYFFEYLEKDLLAVTSMDVADWLKYLAVEKRLAPRTVYGYCSHLSSFYEWLMQIREFAAFIKFNPVKAAFPRFPEAYQSDGTRALSDESLRSLWRVMEQARKSGSPADLRDYAIWRFFAATGDRRQEILSLRGSDIELLKKGLIYYSRKKGGDTVGKTILDPEVRRALIDYLKKTGRSERDTIGRARPLWLSHGNRGAFRSEDANAGLSSRAFSNRMRAFAESCGIFNFHIHQLRHTFARIVAEDTQSISKTQEALGHKNPKTTEIYVGRIVIKADLHSSRLKDRIRRRR